MIAPTLDASMAAKQQTMPEKNRLAAVIVNGALL